MRKKKMKVRPLFDRVVILSEEPEAVTKGGIIIPGNAGEKPLFGKVLAVGPGKFDKGVLVPTGLTVGDRVLFNKQSGIQVKIDGVDVLIMTALEILAIV